MKSVLFLCLFMFSLLYANDVIDVQLSATKENAARGIITFTVTNKSNEDIEILKWGTPFEKELSADIFLVKNSQGTVEYLGRHVTRGREPLGSDYIPLKPEQKITVKVPVYLYYDMKTKDVYEINYPGEFYIKTKGQKFRYTILGPKSTIKIYYAYWKQKNILSNLKPIKFNKCSIEQINALKAAQQKAKSLAKLAAVKAGITGENEIYKKWFGTANNSKKTIVSSYYNTIDSALDTENIIFDCSCLAFETNSTGAYVYNSLPYYINICKGFWGFDYSGFWSQGGVIIHEMSHFKIIAGTDDHAYDFDICKDFSESHPSKAISNANNYMYFAEDILENYYTLTTTIERKIESRKERRGNSMVAGPKSFITTNIVETKSKQLIYIDFDNRKVILLPLKDQDSSHANLQSYKFDTKACRYDLVTDTQIDKHIKHRQTSIVRHDIGLPNRLEEINIENETIVFQIRNSGLKKDITVKYMDLLTKGYILQKDTYQKETRRFNGISFGRDYDLKQDKAASIVLQNLPLNKKERCHMKAVHDGFIGEGSSQSTLSFKYEIEINMANQNDVDMFESSNVHDRWEYRAVKKKEKKPSQFEEEPNSILDLIMGEAYNDLQEDEKKEWDDVADSEKAEEEYDGMTIKDLQMFTN